MGKELQAGVGGVVLRIDKNRSLENAFGRADIYGRKTYEGYTELRFMGMEDDKIILRRIDVSILNDETTMSRSGIYIPSQTTSTTMGTIGGTPFNATTTQQGSGTYIPPRKSNVAVLPPNQIEFIAETSQPIPFEGFAITVLEANPSALRYSIGGQQ
ncbi:MAG: hypothetical protein AB7G24_03390 [Novosphingobium sp.]